MYKSYQYFEKFYYYQIINRPFRKECVEELIEVGAAQLPIVALANDALMQQMK